MRRLLAFQSYCVAVSLPLIYAVRLPLGKKRDGSLATGVSRHATNAARTQRVRACHLLHFLSKERALLDARRSHLYRLACAVHIGFVRMTGRTLDASKFLWAYVGAQLVITPPAMGKRLIPASPAWGVTSHS